ncbi:MAG: Colanic acid biosynthesis glycosyltransferase WcaL [Frankiales bacterium]|nr:Colanic acid biosynthesis glycosyltransferase WcaL [Frankiales bacterium]
MTSARTAVRGRLAYLMSRFPLLSETFIFREMDAMEALGWDVDLYPLIRQRPSVVHEAARGWQRRARRLTLLSWDLLQANLRMARSGPGNYVQLWWTVLRENAARPGFLLRSIVIVPKAVLAAQTMAQEGVTHVHAHYATHPALAAWVVQRLTGIPYSVTVHAHDIFTPTAMTATKLRHAEFVVAVSDFNRRHIATSIGPDVARKTHVVHCGVDLKRYRNRSPAATGSSDPLQLLSIGSLQPYKGHAFLLQACALIKELLPVRCVIVGEGKERRRLVRLVRDLGLESCVVLEGARREDEMTAFLHGADCYVQPSVVAQNGQMEGIPVALMEAMAAGLPVVATALSGVPELVRDGVTGLLVPPRDAKALAEAIIAVRRCPDDAARRAEAGRQLVQQEFSLDASAQQLSALIERVSAGRRIA